MSRSKRKLKNYFLNLPVQLKYTGILLILTVLLYAVLGVLFYHESARSDKMVDNIRLLVPEFKDDAEYAALMTDSLGGETDLKLKLMLGAAFLLITLLFISGIILTHRLVGPIYAVSKYLNTISRGRLRPFRRLRKRDEFRLLEVDLDAVYGFLIKELKEDADLLQRLEQELATGNISPEMAGLIGRRLQRKQEMTADIDTGS